MTLITVKVGLSREYYYRSRLSFYQLNSFLLLIDQEELKENKKAILGVITTGVGGMWRGGGTFYPYCIPKGKNPRSFLGIPKSIHTRKQPKFDHCHCLSACSLACMFLDVVFFNFRNIVPLLFIYFQFYSEIA